MDLRQLRHFAAVVELGSMTRAAQQLNLTQPALTRSVKALEQSIDLQLIERATNGIVLTPAGKSMYQNAKFMITQAGRAVNEARLAADNIGGELSVAIEPAFADLHVHRAIGQLAQQYGPLSINVRTCFGEDAVPLLLDGVIDVAVIIAQLSSQPNGLIFVPLAQMSVAIFVAPDHPLANTPDITKNQLRGARWALLDHPHAQDMLVRYFAAGRMPIPADILRTDSLPLIRQLVLNDGFMAILPPHVMAGSGAVALPAPDFLIVRRMGLITRADARVNATSGHFVALLRDEFHRGGIYEPVQPISYS